MQPGDGAGPHTAEGLRVPEDVSVLRLPPYGAEPNPIGNLRHHLKSRVWGNRACNDYDAPGQAAVDA